MEYVPILLGLGASAGFIATNYILHRGWMLAVQFAAIVLVSTQYALVGVWTVVAVNAVLLARNLVFLLAKPSGASLTVWSWVFAGLLTAATIVFLGWPAGVLDWIALTAGYLNIAAFATQKTVRTKIGLATSSFSWAVFNLLQGNWQNVIGDAFGTVAAVTAIVRLKRARPQSSTHDE